MVEGKIPKGPQNRMLPRTAGHLNCFMQNHVIKSLKESCQLKGALNECRSPNQTRL